jgi:hypothetical protein
MSDEFSGWAIVEVMGHQVVAGYCDHIRVAGTEMLRVTPPDEPPAPTARPEILAAAAIFRITPCTEERIRETIREAIRQRCVPPARQLASGYQPEADDWDDDGCDTEPPPSPEIAPTVPLDLADSLLFAIVNEACAVTRLFDAKATDMQLECGRGTIRRLCRAYETALGHPAPTVSQARIETLIDAAVSANGDGDPPSLADEELMF